MLGNFTFETPTRVHFGKFALLKLKNELRKYGKKILLIYGGGSIKENGIYDRVIEILKKEGNVWNELGGVSSNPTSDLLQKAIKLIGTQPIDLILAIGGGSVCDFAKAVSVAKECSQDPWKTYFLQREEPTKVIPVGCISTIAGTGSEIDSTAVIMGSQSRRKIGRVFSAEVAPRFAIINPEFSFSVPKTYMVSGIFDVMTHVMENYFSGDDDCTSDYLAEGLMRSLIYSSRLALDNPTNYEARSNISWCALLAMSGIISTGKEGDWKLHMIGHAVNAVSDAPHGMTLSAIAIPYYRWATHGNIFKFARFAQNVWNVPANGALEEQAQQGLLALEDWMKELGMALHLSDLGIQEKDLDAICNAVITTRGGYDIITVEELREILKCSL